MAEDYSFPGGSVIEVTSSNVKRLYHDNKEDKLRAEFHHGGRVYEYDNVPMSLLGQVLIGGVSQEGTAASIGSAFYHIITSRPDLHPYKRIDNNE
jgi:hypothetical protein